MSSFVSRVSRSKTAGIDLTACPTGVKDVVTLAGAFPGGDFFAPDGNPMVPSLTAALLNRGTALRDKFEISRQLEGVGAGISFEAGALNLAVGAHCLRKDLALVASLLAEQLRSPSFPPEELAKVKKQFSSGLKQRTESVEHRASEAFQRAIYPAGHPNHPWTTDELLAGLERASLTDIQSFYAAHYGPDNMILVGVGDLDPGALREEVARVFAGWKGGVAARRGIRIGRAREAREESIRMPDKTSVSVVLGQTSGLIYGDPDYPAMQLATGILGQGFTSRLMANVRVKEGLTYGVGAGLGGDLYNEGDWKIGSAFTPALVEKGIASIRRQLELWCEGGVAADELARRKSYSVGSFQVGLATTGGLAGALLRAAQGGFDAAWLAGYPERIGALALEEVNAVIKRHIDPSKMTLVKAGTLPAGTAV